MNRMLQRLHLRNKLVAMCLTVAVLTIGPLTGCGGKTDVKLNAPGTAGTAQALAGTSWTEPTSNVTYHFKDETNLEVADPKLSTPIWGTFAVNSGILDLNLGLKTVSGTWDGEVVVVEGKKLVRNEQS